ncbi:MAG: acyltransferase family protein, partial [Sphingopyxis sp.]
TQWLTWGFQVMPLFFLVGGFSNGLSWAATQRNGGRFTTWFAARVRRLINPVLPLLLIWALVTLFGTQAGIDRAVVKMATQLALVPVWFLAVYLIVTALTPWSHAAWRRFGLTSFFALVAAAVVIDIATLQYGIPYVNFLNFVFVWVAIHQLGYAWHDGRIAAPLLWAAAGLVALGLLVGLGPYPVAMIGVPGSELSNSMPPTLALLALGIAQTGLALALEKPARAMLDGLTAWTTVVLINGMIMTVYLWHLTAFVLVMVAAWLLGGVGLHVEPGSTEWWLARPIWFALYIALLFPFILLFARYESGGKAAEGDVTHARLILGMLMICTGLAMTAAISIASPLGVTGVRLWVVALPFLGAALVGFGPAARLLMRRAET